MRVPRSFATSWAFSFLAACGAGAAEPSVTEPRGAPPTADPVALRAPGSTDEAPRARVGGEVVATVDGTPITLAEVEALAREESIPPLLALRRLEEEVVLARAAGAVARADDPEVRDASRRAAVRELLHRVIEAERTPESISAADVEQRRAEIASALSQPETRRAAHVLVSLERDADEARVDAALRLARRIHGELAASPDPVQAMDAHRGRSGAFDILVEHLDPMRREALDPAFADALFAAAAPGLLPEPVRSSFGVHVVALVEVVPPWEVPREEWEPTLRRQIAAERRAQAVEALARELSDRTPVLVSARAVDLAQSAPLTDEAPAPAGSR